MWDKVLLFTYHKTNKIKVKISFDGCENNVFKCIFDQIFTLGFCWKGFMERVSRVQTLLWGNYILFELIKRDLLQIKWELQGCVSTANSEFRELAVL